MARAGKEVLVKNDLGGKVVEKLRARSLTLAW
jgi:hypothetical protein